MQPQSRKRKNPILASIQHSPIAALISDPRLPENPIIAVNQAFCELTGYGVNEILGRNCKFLAGDETEPWVTERLRAGIRARKPVMVEIRNYKRDGTPFRNAVLVAPVFDRGGNLEYFIGSQVELDGEDEGPATERQRNAANLVDTLSRRQRQILTYLAHGLRNKQIAHELGLSEKTVQMHRTLMLKKLGTCNGADAVRIAVEAGL